MHSTLDFSLRPASKETNLPQHNSRGFLHYVINGLSFIMSKSLSKNLSNENKHTLCFPDNQHFESRFVLKTTKTPVFVFITEIL